MVVIPLVHDKELITLTTHARTNEILTADGNRVAITSVGGPFSIKYEVASKSNLEDLVKKKAGLLLEKANAFLYGENWVYTNLVTGDRVMVFQQVQLYHIDDYLGLCPDADWKRI